MFRIFYTSALGDCDKPVEFSFNGLHNLIGSSAFTIQSKTRFVQVDRGEFKRHSVAAIRALIYRLAISCDQEDHFEAALSGWTRGENLVVVFSDYFGDDEEIYRFTVELNAEARNSYSQVHREMRLEGANSRRYC